MAEVARPHAGTSLQTTVQVDATAEAQGGISFGAQVDPLDRLTRFHERLIAEQLTLRERLGAARLAPALLESKVDLNPHQVEAAVFALGSLSRGGCLLADEVGLGKTIEAGMVIAQLLAEGKTRQLILTPATLRAQWQAELRDKFDIQAKVLDGRKPRESLFEGPGPFICSHPFGANRAELLAQVPWDLVVIDEAHRLRNAYRASNKMARALRLALQDRPKLLLTATPLQNDLLELFGLLSFLDESILGPEHAFRSQFLQDSAAMTEARAEEIRTRLAPAVQRTLRRQVREYVRFTRRRSVVEVFAPSLDEQRLYEQVSEYLQRSEALAMEPGQRTLLTLVYRKLLASSTFAIAPTLRKLAESIRGRLASARLSAQADEFLPPEEVAHFTEEAEEWASDVARPTGIAALASELHELEAYAEQAEKIRVNAKGEALLRALERTFGVARQQGWPEKAVVFTESKRTQEYLARLLSDAGYAGQISILSGDASSPEARRLLVEEFRDRTQILLSTEAGAEGLNLQFCNLVVNYDLPWNPQRIEQRIGRCHRYGQQRDVVVLNFLNRHNAADARLLELLEQKLSLFDGVFGASDEILGALENGVDFERRVLDIYQSCRTTDEINTAFDALRAELETHIDDRMKATRSLLMERFDGDVRRRLKLAGEQVQAALTLRRGRVQALGKSGVLSARTVRERPTESITYLELDGSALPARLAHLHGKEGWWFVYRFEVSGLEREERLVHLVLTRDGQGFRALVSTDAETFAELPAREAPNRAPPAFSVAEAQAEALETARLSLRREFESGGQQERERLKEKLDRYAEECLSEPRAALEQSRQAWETQRQALALLPFDARTAARTESDRLERDFRRRLTALRTQEEKRYAGKDRQLELHAERSKVQDTRSLIASAYFWIT